MGSGSEEKGLLLPDFLRYGGIALAALAVVALFMILGSASRRRRVLEAAALRPEEVARVYLEKIGLLRTGSPGLAPRPHIYLRDGTHAWFQVEGKTAREIFRFYGRDCPGVCLGYEPGVKRRLRADPQGLVREPVRSDKVKETRVTYLFRG